MMTAATDTSMNQHPLDDPRMDGKAALFVPTKTEYVNVLNLGGRWKYRYWNGATATRWFSVSPDHTYNEAMAIASGAEWLGEYPEPA